MSDYDISKMGDLMSMPYDAETHIAALTVARDAAQAEITALREKLAAAESDIALYQSLASSLRQLGFVELDANPPAHLVAGQLKNALNYYKSEKQRVENWKRADADFRAAVAAALAELRAHWNAQYQHYVSMTDDSSWERRQELLTRMGELEFIIAKLDLPEAAPASCTWTLDDDGNYATGCDGLFVVLKDSLAGYQMASCCFCGKPVKEQPK